MWQREEARAEGGGKVVAEGRAIRVELHMRRCGARLSVVAAYMPVRGGAMTKETKDLWDEVEREVMSGAQTMLLGDLNAETREAMDRTPGRAPTPQDRRLWEMMTRAGLWAHSVGQATYQGTSEIDHVMTTAGAAHYLGRAEYRRGETAGDHGYVWVEFKGRPREEEAEEEECRERAKGQRIGNIREGEEQTLFEAKVEEIMERDVGSGMDAGEGEEGAGPRMRRHLLLIQDALKAAGQHLKEERRRGGWE